MHSFTALQDLLKTLLKEADLFSFLFPLLLTKVLAMLIASALFPLLLHHLTSMEKKMSFGCPLDTSQK